MQAFDKFYPNPASLFPTKLEKYTERKIIVQPSRKIICLTEISEALESKIIFSYECRSKSKLPFWDFLLT
jgi:hypothetical protein